MEYQWLFFDADGTLFDYDLAEEKALEGTFHDLGLPFLPHWKTTYRAINHNIWMEFENGRISATALRTRRFELLFEAVQVQADPENFSRRYLHNLAHASDLMPGAEETICALGGRYHLAVITNGLKDVQRPRLARSPIGGRFEVVAISEEMGVAKPDPRFFDLALGLAGSPPRQHVLVIGDSLTSDIQGGNRAGLDTCWFNPKGLPADPRFPAKFEIREIQELSNLLNR